MRELIRGFVIAILLLVQSRVDAQAIRNYEQSVELKNVDKLMMYPQEEWTVATRDEVIANYEKYLAQNPTTINRADVLAEIGAIYAFKTNKAYGLVSNETKAIEYWKSAIEIDPMYISSSTLRARGNLSCRGAKEKRHTQLVGFYLWGLNVTDEMLDNSVKKHVLASPVVFNDSQGKIVDTTYSEVQEQYADEISDMVLKQEKNLRGTISSLGDWALMNSISWARYSEQPLIMLGEILDKLKGTPGEQKIQAAIKEVQAQSSKQ